jgi:hypothetical protein
MGDPGARGVDREHAAVVRGQVAHPRGRGVQRVSGQREGAPHVHVGGVPRHHNRPPRFRPARRGVHGAHGDLRGARIGHVDPLRRGIEDRGAGDPEHAAGNVVARRRRRAQPIAPGHRSGRRVHGHQVPPLRPHVDERAARLRHPARHHGLRDRGTAERRPPHRMQAPGVPGPQTRLQRVPAGPRVVVAERRPAGIQDRTGLGGPHRLRRPEERRQHQQADPHQYAVGDR